MQKLGRIYYYTRGIKLLTIVRIRRGRAVIIFVAIETFNETLKCNNLDGRDKIQSIRAIIIFSFVYAPINTSIAGAIVSQEFYRSMNIFIQYLYFIIRLSMQQELYFVYSLRKELILTSELLIYIIPISRNSVYR